MEKEEFNKLLKSANLSKKEFANILNINPGSLNNWGSSQNIPYWVKSWLENYIKAKDMENNRTSIINDFDDEVKITFEKGYVAFLDVLGFKEYVNSKNLEKINIYINKVEKSINYLKNISTKLDIGYIVISDSIVIYLKHGEDVLDNIEKLKNLCIAIGFLQGILIVEGILIRGAISSGEVYFNNEKNQVIGKAYIDAYLLEDKLVSNPQVILDNKIINELKFNSSKKLIDTINEKNSGYLKYTNCGKTILYEWTENPRIEKDFIEKDFPLFIDYLGIFLNSSEHTLLGHKEELIERIIINIEITIYSNVTLYEKYKWLADYILSHLNKHKDDSIHTFQIFYFKERLNKL